MLHHPHPLQNTMLAMNVKLPPASPSLIFQEIPSTGSHFGIVSKLQWIQTDQREWTLIELCTAICDELYILEIESQQTESQTLSQPTAPFFQAQVNQLSKTKEEHSVHFAKDLILLCCVNQSRTPNRAML